MSEPLKLSQIPPAPAVNQLWRIDGKLWHVLAIAEFNFAHSVTLAVYSASEPLTLVSGSFEPLTLRQFVEMTHGRAVELISGPSGPWRPGGE